MTKLVQLLIFISVVSITVSVSGSAYTTSGGGGGGKDDNNKPWRKILDPTNSHVLKVGRGAVRLQSQATNTNLLFRKVIRGETQVVNDGMNYRMVVQASNPSNGIVTNYESLIHEKHLKELKPVYYKRALD